MHRYRTIIALVFAILLGSGTTVLAADLDKGLRAAQAGDFDAALAEWFPLAEHGDASAQLNLGFMYDRGYGVLENDKTAVKWYTKAAEQGLVEAQFNLGVKYANGDGVPENDKTAVKWYTKAAEQGLADAQYYLGLRYVLGKGVITDYVRAYMWANLAAYNGYEEAAELKADISTDMTSTQIAKAQEMSSRCLERNYKDC